MNTEFKVMVESDEKINMVYLESLTNWEMKFIKEYTADQEEEATEFAKQYAKDNGMEYGGVFYS